MKAGDRIYTYEVDGTKVFGTLQRGETFRGPDDWFVDYDDGESCVVLDMDQIFKID